MIFGDFLDWTGILYPLTFTKINDHSLKIPDSKKTISLTLLLAMLLMVGCNSTNSGGNQSAVHKASSSKPGATKVAINRRISKNQGKFQKLSSYHQSKVSNGDLAEGMSKDAVFLAWGKPDKVTDSTMHGAKSELWMYTGREARPTTSIGIGYGFPYGAGFFDRYNYENHGPGWDFESDVRMVETMDRTVHFKNGSVVGWQRTRRQD